MSRGFTLWFTGLSGAGKSTISTLVEQELRARGLRSGCSTATWLPRIFPGGSGSQGGPRRERSRIGFVCQLPGRNGVAAIAAFISPYREITTRVRPGIGRFVEVYVECPIETLIERDVKGLYRKALAGEIANYAFLTRTRPPLHPEIVIRTAEQSPEQASPRSLSDSKRSATFGPRHWRRQTAGKVEEDGDEDAAQRPLSDDRLHAGGHPLGPPALPVRPEPRRADGPVDELHGDDHRRHDHDAVRRAPDEAVPGRTRDSLVARVQAQARGQDAAGDPPRARLSHHRRSGPDRSSR